MNVILTQPVEIALQTLGAEERRKVAAWFDHLKNWENDDHVRKFARKLDGEENVYVLKTSTELRIFFKLTKPNIVVLDIATKATILSFGNGEDHRR